MVTVAGSGFIACRCAALVLSALLIGVSVLARAATVQPGITLSADGDSIYLGDTIVIEMEAVGILENVDISPLFSHADLLRETTGTRIAVLEGRVVEVRLRRMEFLPRREGDMTFGPLSGESIKGGVSSNTIAVQVLAPVTEQWQPEDDDLQVNVTLSDGSLTQRMDTSNMPFNARIGQKITIDIELKHKHPIADEQLDIPAFDGFDVLAEYEQRRLIQQQNGTPTTGETGTRQGIADGGRSGESFRIITWRYHLFAQASGMLRIAPVRWDGVAIRSRSQRAAFSRQSAAGQLRIQPALPDASWWLPATDVTLTEQWSDDPRELSAGDETFRTITLNARDVLASHLPDIKPLESRAISSTLMKQSRSEKIVGDHIEASATYTFRLNAQSPIPVFLDTVRIPWFDTRQAQMREAIIPARRINVGLPDRADLLAELALAQSWLDALELDMRAYAGRFAYWYLTLALLACVALALLGTELMQLVRERRSTTPVHGTAALPPL